MSKENSQRDYWSSNLDVKNLGGGDSLRRFNLEEELDFYFSPEQLFALKKLWGEEGLRGKRILEIGGGMGVFALFFGNAGSGCLCGGYCAGADLFFESAGASAGACLPNPRRLRRGGSPPLCR